jgi:hypothetical protein
MRCVATSLVCVLLYAVIFPSQSPQKLGGPDFEHAELCVRNSGTRHISTHNSRTCPNLPHSLGCCDEIPACSRRRSVSRTSHISSRLLDLLPCASILGSPWHGSPPSLRFHTWLSTVLRRHISERQRKPSAFYPCWQSSSRKCVIPAPWWRAYTPQQVNRTKRVVLFSSSPTSWGLLVKVF